MAKLNTTSRYKLDSSGMTASPKSDDNPISYSLYKVKDGDTMANLAARLLGNDRRWWELADINPQIKYPEDIAVGHILRVPR